MKVLFIHGGGDDAFRYDADIVGRLRRTLGTDFDIAFPRIDGLERIEWGSTYAQLPELLNVAGPDATVIAHSAGAVAMLKILSNGGRFSVRNLFLLAAPYKTEDSHWGIDDFTFANDFADRLDPRMNVTIYHGKDDDIIPVGDALLYAQKMPTARIRLLDGHEHQFSGSLEFLANDIRAISV